MRSGGYVIDLEKLFLGLGDRTRLRILNLIRNDEICVSHFTDILGESQPKISRHLAYLRKSGIVTARREGTWMHYSIAWPDDTHAASVIESLLDGLDSQQEMRKDRERLMKALGRNASDAQKEKPSKPKAEKKSATEPIEEDDTRETYRDSRRDDELETFLL